MIDLCFLLGALVVAVLTFSWVPLAWLVSELIARVAA